MCNINRSLSAPLAIEHHPLDEFPVLSHSAVPKGQQENPFPSLFNLDSHNGGGGGGGGGGSVPESAPIESIIDVVQTMEDPTVQSVSMEGPSTQITTSEDVKHALKVAYASINISSAGIAGIVIGSVDGQMEDAHRRILKFCTFSLLVAFISAVCLLPIARTFGTYPQGTIIVKILEYITLGALLVAILALSTMILELTVLIGIALILLFLLLAFHLRSYSGTPWIN